MHDKNGKELRVGDAVTFEQYNYGTMEGIIIHANPGATSCNIYVASLHAEYIYDYTAPVEVGDEIPIKMVLTSAGFGWMTARETTFKWRADPLKAVSKHP
jgi:hypothetical protein